jgi:hypothetical protein
MEASSSRARRNHTAEPSEADICMPESKYQWFKAYPIEVVDRPYRVDIIHLDGDSDTKPAETIALKHC